MYRMRKKHPSFVNTGTLETSMLRIPTETMFLGKFPSARNDAGMIITAPLI